MIERFTLPPAHPPATQHHLAEVESVEDVGSTGRIDVRLLDFDGVRDQDAIISARVCVPFAGSSQGAFFIPNIGDEVLVAFINGDPRQAIVVGALWNAANTPPESLGGDGKRVDRWSFVGRAGTRIAIVEEQSGQEKITLETPGGAKLEMTDASGGSIEMSVAGNSFKLDTSGCTLRTCSMFTVQAPSSMDVTTPSASFSSAQVSVSGVVQCSTVNTSTTVSGTYTPGAGNVW